MNNGPYKIMLRKTFKNNSYVKNDIALILYYHISIVYKSLFLKVRMKQGKPLALSLCGYNKKCIYYEMQYEMCLVYEMNTN